MRRSSGKVYRLRLAKAAQPDFVRYSDLKPDQNVCVALRAVHKECFPAVLPKNQDRISKSCRASISSETVAWAVSPSSLSRGGLSAVQRHRAADSTIKHKS